MTKFLTYNNIVVDFNEEDISKYIDIDDIAHHLSKIQRFGGATPLDTSYTIAEHCLNIVNVMLSEGYSRHYCLVGLLHDASEAYLSDIVSGLKQLLPDYKQIEKRFECQILRKYTMFTYVPGSISTIDKQILLSEVKAIMPNKLEIYMEHCHYDLKDHEIKFNGKQSEVKKEFLKVFKHLSDKD